MAEGLAGKGLAVKGLAVSCTMEEIVGLTVMYVVGAFCLLGMADGV